MMSIDGADDMTPQAVQENGKDEDEGSPICFIEHINGEFHVTQEAKEMLEREKGKVAVICVAGPYRTGKSFLLNKLIGQNQNAGGGFKVGASVRACTKGIWIWGKPIKRDGISYLFLDTEGLGSTDQALPYDTKIFSLSVLLSSFFILNTHGTINEHTLNDLELVVNCANQVRLYDKKTAVVEGEEEDEETAKILHTSDLATVFPSFLWVLRDFTLKLTDEENRPISASDYLESCLAQKSNNKAKNRTRETIKNVFLYRDCRTLVRPILDEEQLHILPSVPSSQLRPEFIKQLDALANMIFASARPKQIKGGLVNGPALLGLAEAYTQTMNGGKMPTIYTAWEAVVTTQASQGVESALDVFMARVNTLCTPQHVFEREALEEAFATAEREAVSTLRSLCVGDEQSNRATELTLLSKMNELKRERIAENLILSRTQCQQVLEEVWPEGKELADSEFTHTLLSATEQYRQRALGPCKEEISRLFFEQKLVAFCARLADKATELTSQLEEACSKRDEVRELHQEAVRAVEEQSEISERLEGELADLRLQYSNLTTSSQKSISFLQQQLRQLTEEKESLNTQLRQTKDLLAETEILKQQIIAKQQKSKQRNTALTNELQCEREKLSVLTRQHQELILEQQQHKQQLETMEASCRTVAAEALKQQTLASAAHSSERSQLSSSLEAQVALTRERDEQISELREWVSRLEKEKIQQEEAAAIQTALRLQMIASQRRLVDSDTLASLFFCLLVIVLSARFGFGPAWLS